MPTYSCCMLKGLVYIVITAPSSHQPSSCSKYIKLNICLSYNVKSVSNTKYAYFTYSYYTKKKLVCIIIAAPFSHQPSSCSKCIKLNICLSYNVKLVSTTKYVCFVRPYILRDRKSVV